MLKAILIDSKERTITQVETDGSLESIYKLLGVEGIEAVHVQDRLNNTDTLYVDEKGLLKTYTDEDGNEIDPPAFAFEKGYGYPLVGNGLIIGTGEEGESVSATSSVQFVRDIVRFK
jgi:hypothetical protein